MSEATSEWGYRTVFKNKLFQQPGEYEDEITITFKSEEKLYVSKVFLAHVSAVFKAMFQGKFVEAVSNSLDMKDFSKEDFMEFLLCCHPRTMKELTRRTALQVAPLAEKYDVQPLLKRCQMIIQITTFEQPRQYEDEKTITFKSEEKLYVSKIFLAHVSPVFKAMFQGNFVEAVSNSLDMKDLSKEHFLEFLLCCYPRTMKQLTSLTSRQVAPLAEKYDVQPLLKRCKWKMISDEVKLRMVYR